MNNTVKTTIKKEIRTILRDKKSLMMMLVLPLMIPVLIIVFSFLGDQQVSDIDNKENYLVGINYEVGVEEQKIMDESIFTIKNYKDLDSLKEAYENEEINAYVTKDNNKYIIYMDENDQKSYISGSNFITFLESYNKYQGYNYVIENGLNPDKAFNNLTYEMKSSNEEENFFGNYIIVTCSMFIIMAISLTAIYCTTDTMVGEKERGTLETLLTFPVKSEDLLLGKLLATTIACIITSLLSLILSSITLLIVSNFFEIYKDLSLDINIVNILVGLVTVTLFSVFIGGACIMVASKAKTYKEAQSTLTPISLASVVPLYMEILGVKMSTTLAFIPFVNHVYIFKSIFTKTLEPTDYINVLIMVITTIIYTYIILKVIKKQFKSEKIIFSN